MQVAKKQRDVDSVKVGVKGAEEQKKHSRKVNHIGSLLELLFEQIKCCKLLNMLKIWTAGI